MNKSIFSLIILFLMIPLALALNNEAEVLVIGPDIIPPTINVTSIGCIPDPVNQNSTVTCTAIITDYSGIANVSANVTDPNSTIILMNLTQVGNNYSFTFNQTILLGLYNVSWYAIDNGNNNDSALENFTVIPVLISIITGGGGGGGVGLCPDGQSYIEGLCKTPAGFFDKPKDVIKSFGSYIFPDNPLLGLLFFILFLFLIILLIRRLTEKKDGDNDGSWKRKNFKHENC